MNLHKIKLCTDETDGIPQQDYNVTTNNGIQVFFKDLEQHLIEQIEEADVVVGCVAWLTSKPILKALGKKEAVAIVVQKEDFLRPDIDSPNNWRNKLYELYWNLPYGLTRYDSVLEEFDTKLYNLSFAGDPGIESIRCVGNHNSKNVVAFPRSHHKFLIFCKTKVHDTPYDFSLEWKPYKVWTGSYNLTQNANMSFENAISIKHKTVVKAYFQEWAQVEALSEPLNWDSEWCSPEWRIGT